MDTGEGVSAIVEFNYKAVEEDELELVIGAYIHNIKQMPGGWWQGTLEATGKRGMFPDNFVRVLNTKDEMKVTMRDKPETRNRRCKVIYSYVQVNDDELSLAVGDVIELLGEVEEGWWRGRLKSKIGVFPSNFVTIIEPSPILASRRPSKPIEFPPTLPPKPQREHCRVEFPYAPQNDDELELKVGDIITIISTDLPDWGWWKGELNGKVGVFPDNFVKRLPISDVSPLNDTPPHSQRTAQASNVNSAAANPPSASASTNSTNSTHVTSATGAAATAAAITSAATSKVFIKKSGSTSSTQSSNRKDSFGSYDSLNDILSETGLPSGNVAAQRKSLENKNLDLSNAADTSSRLALKKQQIQQQQQQHHMQETKTTLTNNGSITTTSTTATTTMSSSSSATSELRKSLENLDEKTKTPPPVLTKKPTVPTKKTNSGVTGNFFSGFGKQKTKSSESKLTTAASHDHADGICTSKMSSGVADGSSGGVVMRRAATIAVEDSDFDRVERASILTDMRAGRVKAPKRRPPSAAINVIGESNNNNSIYLNGSGGSSAELLHDDGKPQSSDDNSTGEEQLAKPKPREWEKKKAPWMEELKASQVKKKTSPNVEPRTQGVGGTSTATDRTTKLLGDETKVTSSNHNFTTSTASVISSSISSSSTKVQSSSVSSSVMQQSMTVESSQQSLKKELNTTAGADSMTKSMNTKLSSTSAETSTNGGAVTLDDVRARPNSLSIRNRSISPSLNDNSNTRTTAMKSSATSASSTSSQPTETASSTVNNNMNSTAAALSATSSSTTANTVTNNHQVRVGGNTGGLESSRISELERRVGKLEATVVTQQRTIDELMRLLREETDRVKVLRGELDKYAQCVTQV